MKQRMCFRKLLALVIATAMIVTMLPMSVFAEEAPAADVMIEEYADQVVEDVDVVSSEIVEEAAEVPEEVETEVAAPAEEAVEVPQEEGTEVTVVTDEPAVENGEELTAKEEILFKKVKGLVTKDGMLFKADLTGVSVQVLAPVIKTPAGSYMTAKIVDADRYAAYAAAKCYGKAVSDLFGLELHFYNKKNDIIKKIDKSQVTVTVDGIDADLYTIGRMSGSGLKGQKKSTEPTFTLTANEAYTYVIAGLVDDGIERANGMTAKDGSQSFDLDKGSFRVNVEAPKGAFSGKVAMEANDVTEGSELEADGEIPEIPENTVVAYDISFYNAGDGSELQPEENVTVTIETPLDMSDNYELIHIADDGTRSTVEGATFTENGVEFVADSFSVYAVVRNNIVSGQQYVIYAGTTALAYNGNNLTTATVRVSTSGGQTIVEDDGNDNIVWTFTQSGNGWQISCRQGNTTRYLHHSYSFSSGGSVSLSTSANDATVWTYNSSNHHLYYDGWLGNYYLNSNLSGETTNENQAATIDLAHVETKPDGPVTGDLTYYYYTADGTTEILTSEGAQSPSSWTDVSELAKDLSEQGYVFLEARANSTTGDVISQVNGTHYRKGTQSSGNGDALSSIYFLYMSKYTSEGSVPEDLKGPELAKEVTDNGDGTFKIRLEIEGVTNNIKHGANVVVVFDRTYSMSGTMSSTDNKKRIDAAIDAVQAMVDTLKPGTGANQNDIDFALVEFDRAAEAYDFGTANGISGHTNWTKSGTALTGRVNRYANGANLADSGATAGAGGTNWQEALQETAAVLENKPDNDITYVIFMTDGEPTFYIDATDVSINRDTDDPEYTKAVPYATAIVDAGYHMWDIFCSASDTDLLSELKDDSGAEAYIEGSSTNALKEAFVSVANAMLEAIGAQDAAAEDGVPKMGSFDMDVVDGELQLTNAVYYKNGEVWDDAPPATPSENGVEWDLSSEGTLANGATYAIEFNIWPSQDAYDLIADLNNGLRSYDADGENPISAEQRAQIDEHPDGTYTMKTNTSLTMSYELYGETHHDGITYDVEAMDLPTETITIKKIWPPSEVMNVLDDYGRFAYRDVDGTVKYADRMDLTLWRGEEAYITPIEVTAPTITPTPVPGASEATQEWDNDDLVYISCGNMVEKDGVVTVHETGHDYKLTEPEAFSYFWDLLSDVYHPMVINGTTTMLAEVEIPDIPGSMPATNNIKYEDGGTVYYRFNNKVYKVTSDTNCVLQATNYRRSNLNLTKTVSGVRPTDEYFEYEAVVTASTNEQIWFSANTNGPDAETPEYYMENDWVISGATQEINATTNEPTGFWYANSGDTIKFKIKDGWNVRFLNLYHGSTFSFEEIETGNYAFESVDADIKYDFMNANIGDTWYTIDDENAALITGTIVEPNNRYLVTYTNKFNSFFIYHSGVAGDGNLETRRMPAAGETVDITTELTDGTLYGGYYLDYAGKGTYQDDGVKGEDGVKYTGMNYDWSDAQTQDGTAMTPVAGETYYIKEVPAYYLLNYHQINYKKIDGYLTALYLISAIDDLNYQETGFTLQSTDNQKATKVVSQIQIQNVTTGTTVTLKANTIFRTKGITEAGEYLSYYDATENENYFKKGTFTVLPYWITPDGITVHGVSTRTFTITAMTKAGLSKSDS